MSKPGIVIARAVFPQVIDRLAQHFDVVTNQDDTLWSSAQLITHLQGRVGLFCTASERIDATLLQACPQLRICANMAVGYNNFDLEAMTAHGVLATNAPGVLTETTADFGFALLMATARRVCESEHYLRSGQWTRWRYDMFSQVPTFMVPRWASSGWGASGKASRAGVRTGFGMRVLYHNRTRLDAATEAACGASYSSKDELLAMSDHVVLVLPYSAQSHHTIGAAELARMKPGATLVNIARGGIVDDAALAQALRQGHIAAAGLDVFEGEPQVHPGLLAVPNVVLTPHIASASVPTRWPWPAGGRQPDRLPGQARRRCAPRSTRSCTPRWSSAWAKASSRWPTGWSRCTRAWARCRPWRGRGRRSSTLLTNVKTRGMFGEVQLAGLLEQVFTPEQYAMHVATRPGSARVVEFAIRLPGRWRGTGAPLWLPIDAKFPREDYERLLDAQERADVAGRRGGRQGHRAHPLEAKPSATSTSEPPHTTDFAILFVPTEGLYAEVLRRPGLMEALQREHRVVLAGPTTLLAMLNSLQMGFRTLALEKRSAEVWQVLGAVKTEFGKFGDVLAKVNAQHAETRSRMGRALKKVEALPETQAQSRQRRVDGETDGDAGAA
jgi:gluconate 2-dehydrogenase